MEMSNPKGQHLESAFPLPRGFSCFSWAIHTTVCTSLYLHICVYSGACGAESRQSKGALGQALCQIQQQPLSHRSSDLAKLDLGFADGELKHMWLKRPKSGQGSSWRTEPKSCQMKSVGLQRGSIPWALPASPAGTWGGEKEVPEHRDSPKGWGEQEGGGAADGAGHRHLTLPLLPCSCSFLNLLMANSSQHKLQPMAAALPFLAPYKGFASQCRLVTVKKITESPKKTWIQGEFMKNPQIPSVDRLT